ncbi:MAG: membrane protein insertion efficiency factor YidD [Acidobacteriota bacterium]|nr:membrane protein insertion efficiency factor YidD [Blastocatellia bacterium]MDW8238360.1 membrane protein insertion efficiency factor YidD [Acidobacteriota bacterium]
MTWQQLGKQMVTLPILAYQYGVSPLLLPSCRFIPSCSEYAKQAIERFGVRQGLIMSLRRLLRCHPFHQGGYDPPTDEPMGDTGQSFSVKET